MSSAPATTAQPRRLGQSVWALFAGLLIVVILSVVTDALFYRLGVSRPSASTLPISLFS